MFEKMRKSAESFEALLMEFIEENKLTIQTRENQTAGAVELLIEDAGGHKLAEDVLLVDLMQADKQPALIMGRIKKHWAELKGATNED